MIEHPPIKKLNARSQLMVKRDFPLLIPLLEGYRLPKDDAEAIAFNATLLYHALEGGAKPLSPEDILDIWTLEEIAEFCTLIHELQAGEYEYGFAGEITEGADAG